MTTAVELFWAENQVGGPYENRRDSEQALEERARMFPDLELLMPTNKPGAVVLDYGCGPGHDTIQFLRNGAKHVYYADTSPLALEITEQRLKWHHLGVNADPILVPEDRPPQIPRVDYVHCAGVLHHVSHPGLVLQAFHWALPPHHEARVMVYDGDRSEHSQSLIPITNWWSESEVKHLASLSGLVAEYVGSYDCSADWRPACMAAVYRMTSL